MSGSDGVPIPYNCLYRRVLWVVCRDLLMIALRLRYRFKALHRDRVPRHGSLLIVCNHESFLDPILVGIGARHRRWSSMARATLFTHPVFGRILRGLNSIPVERGSSDLKAMRACVDALKAGQALLVFPEGTRTPDGQLQQFATGTMLLIKRARPTVIPVAVGGTYEAWPRGVSRPRRSGPMGVNYGQPVDADVLLAMSSDDAMAYLKARVSELRDELDQALATPAASAARA